MLRIHVCGYGIKGCYDLLGILAMGPIPVKTRYCSLILYHITFLHCVCINDEIISIEQNGMIYQVYLH